MDIIDKCYTDATDTTIDKHLASATFTNATFKRTRFTINTMAMNGIASLMKSGSNRISLTGLDFFTIVKEFHDRSIGNIQNGVLFNSIHGL